MTKIIWQSPSPLTIHTDDGLLPYPIDSLPTEISKPVLSYHSYGQQPLALIACAAIANISLACQTLANVARDELLISPISIFFIISASSGERKTMIDKSFSQGIRQWQAKTHEALMPEVIEATAMYRAWKAECEGILRQIKRADSELSTLDLQSQYTTLVMQEPEIPLLPELFFEDITQEALIHSLSKGWPSSSLWSDEGGMVLSGGGMQANATKFITTLNRLWDGNSFKTHRKTSKDFTLKHRRFTMSLMLQPFLLEHLLKKQDSVARQSGFLARTLITQPVSSMGNRYYQNPPASLSALDTFHARINTCLDATLDLDHRGSHKIPLLHFSPKAKEKWIAFFNDIESGINKEHHWKSIPDFASKAAENVARLSALFHLFQSKTGDITVESVEQASKIIHWHLLEAKRIFTPAHSQENHQEAQKMLAWLKTRSITQTSSRQIQQFGNFRNKSKREQAIGILLEHNYLAEATENGKRVLFVNPL